MRHSKLVGAVSNCAVSTYHGTYAVRLKTAPTGDESVHLFLESTIMQSRNGAKTQRNDQDLRKFSTQREIVLFLTP